MTIPQTNEIVAIKKLKTGEKYKFNLNSRDYLLTNSNYGPNFPWQFSVYFPEAIQAEEKRKLYLSFTRIQVDEPFSPWSSYPNILNLFVGDTDTRVSCWINPSLGAVNSYYSTLDTIFDRKNFSRLPNDTSDAAYCSGSQNPSFPGLQNFPPFLIGAINSSLPGSNTISTNYAVDVAYYVANGMQVPIWNQTGWYAIILNDTVVDLPYLTAEQTTGIFVEDWNDNTLLNNFCGFWGLPSGSISVSQTPGAAVANLQFAYNNRHNQIALNVPSWFNRIPQEQPFQVYFNRAITTDQLAYPDPRRIQQGIWLKQLFNNSIVFALPLNNPSLARIDYFAGWRHNQVIVNQIVHKLINTQEVCLMGRIFLKGNTRGTANILDDFFPLNLNGTFSEPSGIPFGMENDPEFLTKELESGQVDHLDIQFLSEDGTLITPLAINSVVNIIGYISCF